MNSRRDNMRVQQIKSNLFLKVLNTVLSILVSLCGVASILLLGVCLVMSFVSIFITRDIIHVLGFSLSCWIFAEVNKLIYK